MSAVQACYKITEELFQLVQPPDEDRDGLVEAIEKLLEQRQSLLANIRAPFSAEEEELGKQIIEKNAIIDTRLKKLKEEIQKDMQQLSKKKSSANKYVNPYASLGVNAAFYDKKN
ncbi:flagellar protein FliT [Bacillus sp. Hm123]|uniref:flagellar protein FliT n=1 Tax=Bacillus sp. Hm123 TaxID=3450745 RepID=UPI003F445017